MNMDDCYKNFKVNGKKQSFRIRLITFNTGMGWDTIKKRNKLLNKKFSYILCEEGNFIYKKFLIDFIKNKINLFYEFKKFPKIVVNGDGAQWIKMVAKEFNGLYIHDKWHIYKMLANIFLGKKRQQDKNFLVYNQATDYVDAGNYQDLMKLLIINNISDENIKNFQKIKKGIENQNIDINIGSSAESDVYHFVKSSCSGARIFSYNHFVNMLSIKAYNYNNKV